MVASDSCLIGSDTTVAALGSLTVKAALFHILPEDSICGKDLNLNA